MRKSIATLCLVLAASFSAQASGFSIYEASVRANGMLGAFSAYADHVSTIFYNPAGLAGLEGMQFSAGATIIAPRSTFRNLSPLAPAGEETDMVKENFLVPNLFGSYEIKDGLTAGIGVYAPFGLGTHWPDDWVGRGESIKAEIQTLFVTPAVGYTLPEFGIGKLRVGAGLNIVAHGTVALSRAVQSFTPEGTFSLEGELKQPAYGFNAGLLYQPMDHLTLGFTYRNAVEVEFEGDATFTNLPVGFPSTAEGSASIELPASWVAAINFKPMPDLQIEVDYLWWGWSSYDRLVINFDQTIAALGGDQIVNERNFEDTWQIRGGAEYSGLSVDGLTVRAGIAYDQNPIKEQYVDPTLPDADRLLFSGGFTYSVTDYLDIDAAYIFIRAKERRVDHEDAVLKGVYNTYANLPSLGVTLKF